MKLILAVTKSGGISKNGRIPWNIPADLRFFREKTYGSTVIMGRKTFNSITTLLPGRMNLIVSRTAAIPSYLSDTPSSTSGKIMNITDTIVMGSDLEKSGKDVWVIGGSEIALAFESYIHEIYLSVVNKDYECDVFVPPFVMNALNHRDSIGEIVLKTDDFTTYRFSSWKNHEEIKFQNLIRKIYESGTEEKNERTGFGTRSIFGAQLEFSLKGRKIPMSTLRPCFIKGIFEELMWFFRGQTNSKILEDKRVMVWTGNSSREALDSLGLQNLSEGDCGPIYGFQWRHWGAEYKDCHTDYTGKGIDQLSILINTIKTNPSSRRMLVSGWNVSDLTSMCLPPCHTFYQFNVSDGYLDCHYYQRSSDIFLAGHWNITSASLFTILLAHFTGLRPGKLIVSYGNVHIYNNHLEYVPDYLKNTPYLYPTIRISKTRENLWDYEFDDLTISGYRSHKGDKLKMNV